MKKPDNNPLLEPTPYKNNVYPYDLVKTEHFLPALEWAISDEKNKIDEIKSISSPNFENVIEALEHTSKYLDVVSGVFFHFDSTKNTPELQAISLEFKTKLTKHGGDISLDEGLFKQIKAVADNKEKFNLSDEQKLLLEDIYKSFVRNGALLSSEEKSELRKIDEKLSELINSFGNNLLAATNSFKLFIDDESELSGLPSGAIEASREMAEAEGEPNKWLITLHAPSVMPVLAYADNRELREKVWRAFSTRCKSGEFDNRQNVLDIVKLRAKRANLLGYETHADYVLEERMAKTKGAVFSMIENYKDIVFDFAKKEHEELKHFAARFTSEELKPWDLSYYAEKLKQEEYGFDSEELRPYFEFNSVRQGAFEVASKLYNIRFEQKDYYPKYHETVEVFEVFDNDSNDLVGVFYTDYFPRSTKQGGAWMNDYIAQETLSDGTRKPPVIGNHGNFTKPTKDKPSLLNLEEVLTLFHEFGHGLHGLLSNTKYKSQAGTNVKWDFVELPSQVMENWAKEKEVLDLFAKHYKTGELMPEELITKMKRADNFRAGSFFLRQMQFSNLDMNWHTLSADSDINSVEEFEYSICKDYYILPPEGSLTSPAFSHIFDGGYSAGYYSYKWAEILDADAFEAFKENGLFDADTAKKFRKLLSSGGSQDPQVLYVEFRGRDADPEALLKREGLVA